MILLVKKISEMLKLHHIGNLVDNIDSAIITYQLLFGSECASDKVFISTQRVYVCFIDIGKNIFIELIQPVDENSIIYKMRKKGFSYYHLAYITNNFDKTNEYLLSYNFKHLGIFYSEAFENKRCQFMYSPEGHLIELIEK